MIKDLSFRIGRDRPNIAKEKTAPIVTGRLKRDIKARNATASGVTITQTKAVPYAKYVHGGTKAHIIRPKNKKALANTKAGLFFGKKVNHPGTKANPYLLNAFKIYQTGGGLDRALKDFAQDVGQKIIQEVKIEFK